MPYFVLRDKTRIYYEDHGQGEPIVFLHGLGASHQSIAAFINEFKGEYRCISYDHRGHGSSTHNGIHMNLKNLAQDLHELLDYLDLKDVTVIGHSLGGATIFSYVSQFGCERIKRIVNVDISPCASNRDWKGGLGRGEWTDADFLDDIDRYFDDWAYECWVITKELMSPALKALPPEAEPAMILNCKEFNECDALTGAALWYSVFRTDNRAAADQITVPFLYVLPETPICSTVAVDFLREHVKGSFSVAGPFPDTSHMILMETPVPVAEQVKHFIKEN